MPRNNKRNKALICTGPEFPLGFGLVRICPNDNFIEIFAQAFHYFEDPFYKFFALNLLFQDTSCSLALKYSSFLFKFFSFALYNIYFWFKISKICPKNLHFSQISHSRGNTVQAHTNSHCFFCFSYCFVTTCLLLINFFLEPIFSTIFC